MITASSLKTAAIVVAALTLCAAQALALQEVEFKEPPVEQSQNGLLSLELDVKCFQGTLYGQPNVNLRTYNGLITGPTMRIKAGDVLRVHLSNNLTGEPPQSYCTVAQPTPCQSRGMNCPHGFNTTNLHTHGLHVSPAGNSDNVLIEMAPGQDFQYEYLIPQDHPAGTFFYHPHKHGSAAIQMSSGMGGAIIVEGGIDKFMASKGIEESLFVFQQITFAEKEVGGVKVNILDDFSQLQRNPQDSPPATVNGLLNPVLHVRPGQVVRWRFIHSGIMEMITPRLEGHKMHIYSYDGLNTGRLDTVDQYAMAPGYRIDVLIQAGAAGTYKLHDAANSGDAGIKNQEEPDRILATLVVEGNPVNMQLPTAQQLAPFAYKGVSTEVVKKRNVTFALEPRSQYDFFNINGALFMANESPCNTQGIGFCMKLDTTEEWTITSQDQNHPFHIHVNPFQIVEGNCLDDNTCIWKDTVLIHDGKDTVIRSYFKRYIGRYVFHCHILNHEDQGMMRLVEIQN